MRILFGFLFMCCFGSSPAQRILYTSQDLSRTDTTQAIRTIRPVGLSDNITVIYKNGVKQQINRDSIWGYENRNHQIYRSYGGNLYRMEPADELLEYTCETCRYHHVRYSKTLDSPLYAPKRKARRDPVMNQ